MEISANLSYPAIELGYGTRWIRWRFRVGIEGGHRVKEQSLFGPEKQLGGAKTRAIRPLRRRGRI